MTGHSKKSLRQHEQTKQLATWYRPLCYKTLESWTRSGEWLACRLAHRRDKRLRRGHLWRATAARFISILPKGEDENRFKEQQLNFLVRPNTCTRHLQGTNWGCGSLPELRWWMTCGRVAVCYDEPACGRRWEPSAKPLAGARASPRLSI